MIDSDNIAIDKSRKGTVEPKIKQSIGAMKSHCFALAKERCALLRVRSNKSEQKSTLMIVVSVVLTLFKSSVLYEKDTLKRECPALSGKAT